MRLKSGSPAQSLYENVNDTMHLYEDIVMRMLVFLSQGHFSTLLRN